MEESQSEKSAKLLPVYLTVYDVRTEPDIEPPSPRTIVFGWVVSIISSCVLALSLLFVLYDLFVDDRLWQRALVEFAPILLFAMCGILCGPSMSESLRTAPALRREQEDQRRKLEEGDYETTEGIGVYHQIGRMGTGTAWIAVGSSKIPFGSPHLSGYHLRVSHRGERILKVEKRVFRPMYSNQD